MVQAQRQPSRKPATSATREERHAAKDHAKKFSKPPARLETMLTLPARPDWHAAELPTMAITDETSPVPAPLLEKIFSHANSLLDAENATYVATHSQASSSYKFMSTIMSTGTWSDKVSALTLVVQESPLHTMKPLENLVNLAGKRSRSQALMALGALKDMLSQGALLPSDRKLRMFTKQPGLLAALHNIRPSWTAKDPLPIGLESGHLILWAYEDWLKRQVFETLKNMESWCNDEVEFARLRALTFVWELLKEKPEQEENLLRLVVNKLGDTSRKVASRASHLLLQLQITHPSMKATIINAIESDILLRTGQSSHAKYYATITLNQTVLQISDPDVANKLLEVYFSLFVTILNRSKQDNSQKKGVDSKVDGELSKKRKRHSVNASNDVNQAEQELEDKITAQVLTGINRAFPFSKKDSLVFEKHLNTMFRITHSANFNTSVQALMLIQQISSSQHLSTDRFLRTLYESLLDPRLLKSSKQTMYLNLIYRSLKGDVSVRRIKAFVKRLLQIIALHEPPFVCAVLFLIMELQTIFPGVKAMMDHPEALDADDEEVFADVPEDLEDGGPTDWQPKQNGSAAPAPVNDSRSSAYDGRKRDPEHSNADQTCLWELPPWLNHYHPSVTLFASHLLSTHTHPSPAPPKPDPTSHTLIHFLDRFAYRNPKQKAEGGLRGTSLMQPALASTHAADSFVTAGGTKDAPLNTEAFWTLRTEDVRPDEVFFHRYFKEVGPRRKGREERKKKEGDGGDGEGESGVEDEAEIWEALVGSAPELDGGSDVDMDDAEDDEDEDEELDTGESNEEDGGVDIEGGLDLDHLGVDDDEESDLEAPRTLADLEAEEDIVGGDGEDDDLDDADPFNLAEEGSALFSSEEDEEIARPSKKIREKGGKGKRRLRDLPTFASAEDYAEMLQDDGDGDEEV